MSALTTGALLLVGLVLGSCTRGAAERSPGERLSGEQAEERGGQTDPSIISGSIFDNFLPGAPQELEAPQWVYDRSFSCIEAVFGCRPDLEHPRQ